MACKGLDSVQRCASVHYNPSPCIYAVVADAVSNGAQYQRSQWTDLSMSSCEVDLQTGQEHRGL